MGQAIDALMGVVLGGSQEFIHDDLQLSEPRYASSLLHILIHTPSDDAEQGYLRGVPLSEFVYRIPYSLVVFHPRDLTRREAILQVRKSTRGR